MFCYGTLFYFGQISRIFRSKGPSNPWTRRSDQDWAPPNLLWPYIPVRSKNRMTRTRRIEERTLVCCPSTCLDVEQTNRAKHAWIDSHKIPRIARWKCWKIQAQSRFTLKSNLARKWLGANPLVIWRLQEIVGAGSDMDVKSLLWSSNYCIRCSSSPRAWSHRQASELSDWWMCLWQSVCVMICCVSSCRMSV